MSKDVLTQLDEMSDEELWERLEKCDDFGLTELFSNPSLQSRIENISLVGGTVLLDGDEKFEGFNTSLITIGLYDTLPQPITTEDVVRKGYGSYYEIYSPTLVGQELVWKKVAWSY